MMSSIKDNVTPWCDDFQQHCQNWLVANFPSAVANGALVEGKSVDKWLEYISVETKSRWRQAGRSWKTLLSKPQSKKFFGVPIKVTLNEEASATDLDTAMDTTANSDLNEMELEHEALAPINLGDLSVFQEFFCPRCDFKSKDRILFKTHVIKNHDYVKGNT